MDDVRLALGAVNDGTVPRPPIASVEREEGILHRSVERREAHLLVESACGKPGGPSTVRRKGPAPCLESIQACLVPIVTPFAQARLSAGDAT